MASFISKAERQRIVKEFAVRHNGTYNPSLFLAEVRRVGTEHPAYSWFEWDESKAARSHQVWQAREFAAGLRVSFKVEEVGRRGAVTVRTINMPLVISPVGGRKDGGGYLLADPRNEDHQAEHARQAAVALRAWLLRYEAALAYAGEPAASAERIIAALEKSSQQALAAAE